MARLCTRSGVSATDRVIMLDKFRLKIGRFLATLTIVLDKFAPKIRQKSMWGTRFETISGEVFSFIFRDPSSAHRNWSEISEFRLISARSPPAIWSDRIFQFFS